MGINKTEEGHVGKGLYEALAGDFMSTVESHHQIDIFPFAGKGD